MVVKSTKGYVVGDEIKNIAEIEECDKPDFIELTEDALAHMFKDLIKDDADECEELGNEYNFSEIYDAQWYAERFPGFTPEEYWFMSKATSLD